MIDKEKIREYLNEICSEVHYLVKQENDVRKIIELSKIEDRAFEIARELEKEIYD